MLVTKPELNLTETTSALPAPAPIQQLHHYAYRAKDAEETRQIGRAHV